MFYLDAWYKHLFKSVHWENNVNGDHLYLVTYLVNARYFMSYLFDLIVLKDNYPL